MKKNVQRLAVMLLALLMILSQYLVAFGMSITDSERTSSIEKKGISMSVMETREKGIGTKNKTDSAKQADEKQNLDKQTDKSVGEETFTKKDKRDIESEIVPGQVIVKYKKGTADRLMKASSSKVSAISSKKIDRIGVTQLELPEDVDTYTAVKILNEDSNVEYAEPVYVRKAFGMGSKSNSSVVESVYCSDPFYTKGWQWGLEALNMEKMWREVSIDKRSRVTIAVIDSGVDIDHSELKDSIISGYDFVNGDMDADDDCGHGTHVAGIAAAAHDGRGIAGVAGGAKIMPVKVLDEYGLGSTATVINGILYAVNNGADIINLSLGSKRESIAEEEAIKYALDRGITVIAATGNDGGSVSYPARYDGVIAVGALDWNKKFEMPGFSNRGPELDILAPGVDILSTIPIELDNPCNHMYNGIGDEIEDGYSLLDGTSMAAPFVSGMAAMLLAENTELNGDEVLNKLKSMGKTSVEGLCVLNSGSGSEPPFTLRRAVLSRGSLGSTGECEIELYFEDSKGTVTDEVYGTFDLKVREFEYLNGFEWASEPESAGSIEIKEGQEYGSVKVQIPEPEKDYVYYIEGSDSYMYSKPVYIVQESNGSFEDPQQLRINVEAETHLDFIGDVDYFKFTIRPEDEGYYVIESTGELDTYGYLYDAEGNLIAEDDESGEGHNFRIDECSGKYYGKYGTFDGLELPEGTYYVEVEGYYGDEIGSYGIIVKKRDAISGTVSLPEGIIAPQDITICITLYSWNTERGKYDLEGYERIDIQKGEPSADYEILADPDKYYIVEYEIDDTYADTIEGYVYTGYYSKNGTVSSADRATSVVAGTESFDITLIPVSAADDNEGNTFEEAALLQLGTSVKGTVHFVGDIDIYKLYIGKKDSYGIGVAISSDIDVRLYRYLFDSQGNLVYTTGNTSWDNGNENFRYYIYDLEPGWYYYAVSGNKYSRDVFNTFEYKAGVQKVSKISGHMLLPDDFPMDDEEYAGTSIEITATSPQGISYNTYYDYIDYEDGKDYYVLGVPSSAGYIINYAIYYDYDKKEHYLKYATQGYYSTDGTKEDIASATAVDATKDTDGINLNIIYATDTEGNDKSTAKPISVNTLVRGRINSAKDEDYFKFRVPEGGGYYYIVIDSEEYVSIYIETEGDWLLYDEGYRSLIYCSASEGDYYLKIRAEDEYYEDPHLYGDYRFMVCSLSLPVASNVRISGTTKVGSTLIGNYTYYDSDGDKELGSTFRWLRSDSIDGTYTAIEGANARTYKLTQNDKGKYIKFEVTPRAEYEPTTGFAVTSKAVGPIQASDSGNSGGSSGSGGSGGGKSGKGGGGGGGAGGGSSVSPVVNKNISYEEIESGTAAINKEAGEKNTVEVKVNSNKLSSALNAAGKAPVVINAKTKAKQDNLKVNIPTDVIAKASETQKTIIIDSNDVRLSIQPGTFDTESLSGEVEFEVLQLSPDSIEDIIAKKDGAADELSLVFDFNLLAGGEKITEFNKPVTITVNFDVSKATDLNKVGIYWYNEKDGKWEYVGGKANPDGTITFTVEHFSKYAVMEYKKTFDDIKDNWARSEIELLIAKHIARSESETSFAPDSNITRAAFASMLVKALDIKATDTDKVFVDIPIDAWYKDDIYIAYGAGIIDGVSSDHFAPNEHITREQMAAMLMRAYEYVSGNKLDEMVTTMHVRFTDESSISSWAKRSVILANAVGFIAGNPDGTFNPKGNTTKAQAVVVVKRLMEKVGHGDR